MMEHSETFLVEHAHHLFSNRMLTDRATELLDIVLAMDVALSREIDMRHAIRVRARSFL